ncbi:dioxygenase family protein [Nitrospina watsonii]|uniref:Intradiol ring-cleavage dioxygenase n=1 Tax=Nitrospina watsonii TaxID=1323948 RepID=A0ABM9HBK4_9BACT|nr:twin-arginine translocation signal domain-containing protein [Nitrospina watsonii]CAI2717577.1 Putative Intradiol ring-cleavage dioxygenase [Nitrospina watsonii]
MRHNTDSSSRRNFLKTGLGALGGLAGTLVAGSAWGQAMRLTTPRQTLGPFFPDEGDAVHEIRENLDFRLPISEANDNDLTFIQGHAGTATGQVIHIEGKVWFRWQGEIKPQPGAAIIMWNAAASGRYNHRGDREAMRFKHPVSGEWVERTHDEHFQYWGRCITDEEGNYSFKTILPGFYPVDMKNGWYRPPHLHFMVTAPGIPQLVTQLYFKGEHIADNGFIQQLNARDLILRDRKLTAEEQENLIVEYRPDPSEENADALIGNYDFVLSF